MKTNANQKYVELNTVQKLKDKNKILLTALTFTYEVMKR